jgi:hypothetical protein
MLLHILSQKHRNYISALLCCIAERLTLLPHTQRNRTAVLFCLVNLCLISLLLDVYITKQISEFNNKLNKISADVYLCIYCRRGGDDFLGGNKSVAGEFISAHLMLI